jgi:hypothetical protein
MFDFRESYVPQRFERRFPVGGPSAAEERHPFLLWKFLLPK